MFGHHQGKGAHGCGTASEKSSEFYKSRMQGSSYRRPKFNVPVNVINTEEHYEVNVYAIGFEKENIKISVENDILHISGTRSVDESKLPNFSQQEFPIKVFERVLGLNGQVNVNVISASQEGGILKIILPKNAESKNAARDIKVE